MREGLDVDRTGVTRLVEYSWVGQGVPQRLRGPLTGPGSRTGSETRKERSRRTSWEGSETGAASPETGAASPERGAASPGRPGEADPTRGRSAGESGESHRPRPGTRKHHFRTEEGPASQAQTPTCNVGVVVGHYTNRRGSFLTQRLRAHLCTSRLMSFLSSSSPSLSETRVRQSLQALRRSVVSGRLGGTDGRTQCDEYGGRRRFGTRFNRS